jgi:membrane protease YdiL (CAAX protease family)
MRRRSPLQFVVWTLALSVIFTRLYNSTNGSLPIVIICHAAIDTAGRYMLPEFSNGAIRSCGGSWSCSTR